MDAATAVAGLHRAPGKQDRQRLLDDYGPAHVEVLTGSAATMAGFPDSDCLSTPAE